MKIRLVLQTWLLSGSLLLQKLLTEEEEEEEEAASLHVVSFYWFGFGFNNLISDVYGDVDIYNGSLFSYCAIVLEIGICVKIN